MRWFLGLAVLLTGACDQALPPDALVDAASDAGPTYGDLEPVILECPTGRTAGEVTIDRSQTLFVYSCSTTTGERGLFEAPRSTAVHGGFSTPILATSANEHSPEISPDGLSLYYLTFSAANVGRIELMQRTDLVAPWASVPLPPGLDTAGDDRPGSPDATGEHIVISRAGVLVELQRSGATWNTVATTAALSPQTKAVSPHLSADGLTLVFVAETVSQNLFIARRAAIGDTWGAAVQIFELNTAVNETDPWLSADQAELYYTRGSVLLRAHR